MWIFSTFGFFSVVKKGKIGTWQIRARELKDAQNLCDRLGIQDSRILKNQGTDYAFRVVVSKDELDRFTAELAESVDYDNFKNEIKHTPDQMHKVHALMDIWTIMFRLQPPGKNRFMF